MAKEGVLTIYPGGDGSEPIKTYPEKMEKEIRNMVMSNLELCPGTLMDGTHLPVFVVKDLEGFIIDMLEYIINSYGKK